MKILKFGAIWCKECLVMRPIWEEIEKELPELKTEYYDADENPNLLKEYKINDIPIFIFLDNNNKEILRLKGMQNKEELMKIIKENL
ncbi:MAG: thioredoxin family protein [Candidatus Falkowbacteria bacterium]